MGDDHRTFRGKFDLLVNRKVLVFVLSYTLVFTIGYTAKFQSSIRKFDITDEVMVNKCDSSPGSGSGYTEENLEKERKIQLRLDYTQLERISPLSRDIAAMQKNCSLTKQGIVVQRNCCGLGSDLHVYGLALCYAMEVKDVRVRNIGHWMWRDEDHCHDYDEAMSHPWKSPMKCYFPETENLCTEHDAEFDEFQLHDKDQAFNLTQENGDVNTDICPTVAMQAGGMSAVRASATEFLFTRVADIVQQEGQRQLEIVFGINGTEGHVPNNLITVHIRWGDKILETTLIPISWYIDAVYDIVSARRNANGKKNMGIADEDEVNIYLSTDDPEALDQFMAAKPDHWKVFVDQYYVEYLPYRIQSWDHAGNVNNRGAQVGLLALGSLLVAMEANDFVLTLTSNWSRLMNEIRKNIIDPRCGGCTRMIDLNHGNWV